MIHDPRTVACTAENGGSRILISFAVSFLLGGVIARQVVIADLSLGCHDYTEREELCSDVSTSEQALP